MLENVNVQFWGQLEFENKNNLPRILKIQANLFQMKLKYQNLNVFKNLKHSIAKTIMICSKSRLESPSYNTIPRIAFPFFINNVIDEGLILNTYKE